MINRSTMNALGGKFQVRAARWTDVSAIVNLRNASSQSTRGLDVTGTHWQKRHWYDSGIDLATDSLLVLDADSAIAYAELVSESPCVVYEMVGVVHPDYRRQSVGTQLIRWAENQVRQSLDKAPDGAAVFIHNSTFDSNQPGCDLLADNGFEIVCDFVNLQIQMNRKPPDPIWVDGIKIRHLCPTDWGKVGPALTEAFNDHWGIVAYKAEDMKDERMTEKPSIEKSDPDAFDDAYFNSPGLCFVAWDGDQVVGSCLCNAKTVEFPDAGYIGSLGVRRPWRGRGIGRTLTLHALNAFFERGTTLVLTDTDGDSLTKAYRLYQKAGMQAFRWEYVYEKMICPGRDYVKREMTTLRED
jgi:ribosomal protein S18 acetylase RimI-like enzyme